MLIASYIDHTFLKATTSRTDIERICTEARQFQFAAVCIPPPWIGLAKAQTLGSGVKVATVIGFPFGYSAITAKLAEMAEVLRDGADEVDMVINLIQLKAGNWDYLEKEMSPILGLVRKAGKLLKVIIESGSLDDDEIKSCCKIYGDMEVDYLKTSTGYAEAGASVHQVALMRALLPPTVKIKASGGIRTYEFARRLIEAGASRLGCSASLAIAATEPGQEPAGASLLSR